MTEPEEIERLDEILAALYMPAMQVDDAPVITTFYDGPGRDDPVELIGTGDFGQVREREHPYKLLSPSQKDTLRNKNFIIQEGQRFFEMVGTTFGGGIEERQIDLVEYFNLQPYYR